MITISNHIVKTNTEFVRNFWKIASDLTMCSAYKKQFIKEERNMEEYLRIIKNIFVYYGNLYTNTLTLDEKALVILSLSTYSYKRFKELVEHNLANSIAGRSCTRSLVENYILLKFLLVKEKEHADIWKDFQIYGIGQYKLVLDRYRESANKQLVSQYDPDYIQRIVNEFLNEEAINMDVSYFGKNNTRLKAKEVGEEDLYGLIYDYDSAFEHGLWGAIRESTLLKCGNPMHLYHNIPDIGDEIVLKSVLPDAIMLINKTIHILYELYGMPEMLRKEWEGYCV
jgi:hypothetical protein